MSARARRSDSGTAKASLGVDDLPGSTPAGHVQVSGSESDPKAVHTPGPWVAIPTKSRWYGHAPIFENGLWDILPASNLERIPICTVDHADDHHEPSRAQAEVDARLIAATPDLLAALRDVLRHPDILEDLEHLDRGVGGATEFGRILIAARKVLAKVDAR